VEWLRLAQDRDKLRDLVNMAMNSSYVKYSVFVFKTNKLLAP
jgi:hypothetical protein